MNLIVVVDKNWAIGCGNNLLYRVPADMKFFKRVTMGKVVVMGGKTYASLPGGALKGRTNIVLSRSAKSNENVIVCGTLESLFAELDKYCDEDIFIIGGGMFYHTMLPCCDTAYVTKIDAETAEADTFFPSLDSSDERPLYWSLVQTSDEQESNGHRFTFNTYRQSPHITKELRRLLYDGGKELGEILDVIGGEAQKTAAAHIRSSGAYYTSEENIEKVIRPLFLDELELELCRAKSSVEELCAFHEKIGRLEFFDPACGCGNFLVVAYKELRLLELEVLKLKAEYGCRDFSFRVNLSQFYGIEIDQSLCDLAKRSTLFFDQKMNARALDELKRLNIPEELEKNLVPRVEVATIECGNALQMDWQRKDTLSYIFGNPPFVGYSYQSPQQKSDVMSACVGSNGKPLRMAGKLDYCAAWFYKAAQLMRDTQIRAAFVSTNSLVQGEQVAALWEPLINDYGMCIDFAHRTFKWKNEAKGQAAVHCVVVGFSAQNDRQKFIHDGKRKICAKNINPYLAQAPNVFIKNRETPRFDSPEMVCGSKPVCGGYLMIDASEYEDFVAREPQAAQYIRRFVGAHEYINGILRYCLWLNGSEDLRDMPLVAQRVEGVRRTRLASPKALTRKSAETPMLFQQIRQPDSDYILIPSASSEKRQYIPIGFMPKEVIASNAVNIIPNANLYHFGILTSSMHMAWVRTVCGRLKSDYRYSAKIVYNNFPWPKAGEREQAEITQLAENVLKARSLYDGCTLACLYASGAQERFPELWQAHRELDAAVLRLYGVQDADVAHLLKLVIDDA